MDKYNWALVDQQDKIIMKGDIVRSFRGDTDTVISGRPPNKSSSSGFVNTTGGEYYAHVYGLKWVKVWDTVEE